MERVVINVAKDKVFRRTGYWIVCILGQVDCDWRGLFGAIAAKDHR